MTQHPPQQEEAGDQQEDIASPEWDIPTPTGSHLRPLPNPSPDERLYASPPKLAAYRSRSLSNPLSSPESADSGTEREALPPFQSGARASVAGAHIPARFPVPKPPPHTRRTKLPDISDRQDDEQGPQVAGPQHTSTAEAIVGEAEEEGERVRRSPLLVFLLYVALAFGSTNLGSEVRYLTMWILLLVLGVALLLFDAERPPQAIDPVSVTWGAGIGFVLSLPIMLTATRGLAQASRALIPIASNDALFQALVITWPLGETLFYRGALQRDYGLVVAALVAGVGNLLLYLPVTTGVFSVLIVAVSFATVLAFIYGYVREQYGLAAAYVCQVVTNLMLLFLPRFLAAGV